MRDMWIWILTPALAAGIATCVWITTQGWWTNTRLVNSLFMTLAIASVSGILGFLLWDYWITNVDPARTISNLGRLHAGRNKDDYLAGLWQGVKTVALLVFIMGFVGGHLFWPKGITGFRTYFAWGNLHGALLALIVIFPLAYWCGHMVWGQDLIWDQDAPEYIEQVRE